MSENSGAHRIYQPPVDCTPDHIAEQILAGKPTLLADLEAEARQAHKELPDGSTGYWCECAHVPVLFVAAVTGYCASPHTVMVDDLLVSFTIAQGLTTHDPAEITELWAQFRAAVTATRVTGPHDTRIEPRLPAQVTSVHWQAERGDVTLTHPDRNRHRRPRRFLTITAPIAGWVAAMHGRIPSGLGPISAAAGVIAVASITAGAAPAVSHAQPKPGTTREAFVPPRAELPAATRSPRTHLPHGARRVRMSAPGPSQGPSAASSGGSGTPSSDPPALPAPAVTVAVTPPGVSVTASVPAPAATPGTAPPIQVAPKLKVSVSAPAGCVTVRVLGLKAGTCQQR